MGALLFRAAKPVAVQVNWCRGAQVNGYVALILGIRGCIPGARLGSGTLAGLIRVALHNLCTQRLRHSIQPFALQEAQQLVQRIKRATRLHAQVCALQPLHASQVHAGNGNGVLLQQGCRGAGVIAPIILPLTPLTVTTGL